MTKTNLTTDSAYSLFENLIKIAQKTLLDFTLSQRENISKKIKADKTLVTGCDRKIDDVLSKVCKNLGYSVVSEEGSQVLDIVKSGNYITIDPIDGSLGYLDYVNYTFFEKKGDFISTDLGPQSDFCLLIGIVENNIPAYGCCYNYFSKEKILVDGSSKKNLIRERSLRDYKGKNVAYLDQRPGTELEKELLNMKDVIGIKQATVGLKSIYTIINEHESAVTLHQVQTSGLWDVMPAAVAACAFGGEICDELGKSLKTNEYIILPGKGCLILKGEKFEFVKNRLSNNF